jgi:hypothetical protein
MPKDSGCTDNKPTKKILTQWIQELGVASEQGVSTDPIKNISIRET